ncbi:MAG: rhodanese-like domain-containing protein [Candidatus Schekmanbacteria bacterium]|nr:rhodanese-like domain-containing protein [Candidatus Schekmanbacteria bacterium]
MPLNNILGTSDAPDAAAIQKERPKNIIGNISAQELYARLQAKEDFILLDVREEGEYAEGHIEGARLIPWTALRTRHEELDPEKEIVVYCHSGIRSQNASASLIFYGFKRVNQLGGGIQEWQKNNFPVIKGMTRHAQ